MADFRKVEGTKVVQNPLLSGAGVSFPFEQFQSTSLLLPVPRDPTPVLLQDEGEVDTFVGQEAPPQHFEPVRDPQQLPPSAAASDLTGAVTQTVTGLFNSFFGSASPAEQPRPPDVPAAGQSSLGSTPRSFSPFVHVPSVTSYSPALFVPEEKTSAIQPAAAHTSVQSPHSSLPPPPVSQFSALQGNLYRQQPKVNRPAPALAPVGHFVPVSQPEQPRSSTADFLNADVHLEDNAGSTSSSNDSIVADLQNRFETTLISADPVPISIAGQQVSTPFENIQAQEIFTPPLVVPKDGQPDLDVSPCFSSPPPRPNSNQSVWSHKSYGAIGQPIEHYNFSHDAGKHSSHQPNFGTADLKEAHLIYEVQHQGLGQLPNTTEQLIGTSTRLDSCKRSPEKTPNPESESHEKIFYDQQDPDGIVNSGHSQAERNFYSQPNENSHSEVIGTPEKPSHQPRPSAPSLSEVPLQFSSTSTSPLDGFQPPPPQAAPTSSVTGPATLQPSLPPGPGPTPPVTGAGRFRRGTNRRPVYAPVPGLSSGVPQEPSFGQFSATSATPPQQFPPASSFASAPPPHFNSSLPFGDYPAASGTPPQLFTPSTTSQDLTSQPQLFNPLALETQPKVLEPATPFSLNPVAPGAQPQLSDPVTSSGQIPATSGIPPQVFNSTLAFGQDYSPSVLQPDVVNPLFGQGPAKQLPVVDTATGFSQDPSAPVTKSDALKTTQARDGALVEEPAHLQTTSSSTPSHFDSHQTLSSDNISQKTAFFTPPPLFNPINSTSGLGPPVPAPFITSPSSSTTFSQQLSGPDVASSDLTPHLPSIASAPDSDPSAVGCVPLLAPSHFFGSAVNKQATPTSVSNRIVSPPNVSSPSSVTPSFSPYHFDQSQATPLAPSPLVNPLSQAPSVIPSPSLFFQSFTGPPTVPSPLQSDYSSSFFDSAQVHTVQSLPKSTATTTQESVHSLPTSTVNSLTSASQAFSAPPTADFFTPSSTNSFERIPQPFSSSTTTQFQSDGPQVTTVSSFFDIGAPLQQSGPASRLFSPAQPEILGNFSALTPLSSDPKPLFETPIVSEVFDEDISLNQPPPTNTFFNSQECLSQPISQHSNISSPPLDPRLSFSETSTTFESIPSQVEPTYSLTPFQPKTAPQEPATVPTSHPASFNPPPTSSFFEPTPSKTSAFFDPKGPPPAKTFFDVPPHQPSLASTLFDAKPLLTPPTSVSSIYNPSIPQPTSASTFFDGQPVANQVLFDGSSSLAMASSPSNTDTLNTVDLSTPPRPARTPSPSVVPQRLLNLGQSGIIYRPPYFHWFWNSGTDNDAWQPFSMSDSMELEQAFNSENLTMETTVATDGGRYDVAVVARRRDAVYWQEPPRDVRRCSWFHRKTTDTKSRPYDENTAFILEEEYKMAVTSAAWKRRVELPDGEYVVMYGPASIAHFLPSIQAPEGFDASQDNGLNQKRPWVVKRGVDDVEIDDGDSPVVDHLLFVVHGIGSACDLKFRTIEEAVNDFRQLSQQLVRRHYQSSQEIGEVNRVEVLPVSWHQNLHEETGVDDKLKQITLKSIPKLRHFTNDTLLDILFYTSPVYCQKIMDQVGQELNRLFALFRSRNPCFQGNVSVAGHSLGSLILFDMLCHQKRPDIHKTTQSADGTDDAGCSATRDRLLTRTGSYVSGTAGTGQPCICYPQLQFQPNSFYAMGSPIGMFVTVRGIDSLGLDFRLPTCPGLFNIFHPFDPVAYRLEALINPDLAANRPVLIPHHKGRKRMHLELRETMARVGADLRQRVLDTVRGTWNAVYQMTSFGRSEEAIREEVEEALTSQFHPRLRTESSSEDDLNGAVIGAANGLNVGVANQGRRVDYVLQEAPLESFNEYVSAITSHVCYWDSEDTVLFILKDIYSNMGISADSAAIIAACEEVTQGGPVAPTDPSTPPPLNLSHEAGIDPTAPMSSLTPLQPPPMTGFVRK